MIRAAPQEDVPESGHPPTPEGSTTELESAPPALLTSQEVLRGRKTVAITHNGALYRLQTTRQGKLILTK